MSMVYGNPVRLPAAWQSEFSTGRGELRVYRVVAAAAVAATTAAPAPAR